MLVDLDALLCSKIVYETKQKNFIIFSKKLCSQENYEQLGEDKITREYIFWGKIELHISGIKIDQSYHA